MPRSSSPARARCAVAAVCGRASSVLAAVLLVGGFLAAAWILGSAPAAQAEVVAVGGDAPLEVLSGPVSGTPVSETLDAVHRLTPQERATRPLSAEAAAQAPPVVDGLRDQALKTVNGLGHAHTTGPAPAPVDRTPSETPPAQEPDRTPETARDADPGGGIRSHEQARRPGVDSAEASAPSAGPPPGPEHIRPDRALGGPATGSAPPSAQAQAPGPAPAALVAGYLPAVTAPVPAAALVPADRRALHAVPTGPAAEPTFSPD